MLSLNYCTVICRLADDLHTHRLSSSSTRSPRQVQLTLPWGVSRQRSPQPPFMFRQGDSSPSTTTTQTPLDGPKRTIEIKFKKKKKRNKCTPAEHQRKPVCNHCSLRWGDSLLWPSMKLSQLLRHITRTHHFSNQVESSCFPNKLESRQLTTALIRVWNAAHSFLPLLKGEKKKIKKWKGWLLNWAQSALTGSKYVNFLHPLLAWGAVQKSSVRRVKQKAQPNDKKLSRSFCLRRLLRGTWALVATDVANVQQLFSF